MRPTRLLKHHPFHCWYSHAPIHILIVFLFIRRILLKPISNLKIRKGPRRFPLLSQNSIAVLSLIRLTPLAAIRLIALHKQVAEWVTRIQLNFLRLRPEPMPHLDQLTEQVSAVDLSIANHRALSLRRRDGAAAAFISLHVITIPAKP